MKKILVTLLVVGSMVFALAAAAMASNVYVDGLVSGSAKIENGSSLEPDYTGYALGANFNSGKFLFNLEYAKDTMKACGGMPDINLDTINFKCGYTLFGGEQRYLALTAGYHQAKTDLNTNDQFSGVIVGLTGTTNLSEKALLEGYAGYSVSGTCKSDGQKDIDTDILLAQVKCSYYLTDNFGLGIGYKYTQYKDDNDNKETMSGPTVGLTYKF